jgi:hypothetical protein
LPLCEFSLSARTRCSAVVLGDHTSRSFISPVHEHKRTRLLHQVLARLFLELDFHSVYQPLCAADSLLTRLHQLAALAALDASSSQSPRSGLADVTLDQTHGRLKL